MAVWRRADVPGLEDDLAAGRWRFRRRWRTAGRRFTWRFSAWDVAPGDEVIVADYTFPATGHAVIWVGATPVFADVRPDTWCVDLDAAAPW